MKQENIYKYSIYLNDKYYLVSEETLEDYYRRLNQLKPEQNTSKA